MNLSTIRLLLRPAPGALGVVLIPATAFALVSALVLLVVGGAQAFWTWTDDRALLYRLLASVALVLLVMPLGALGGAAARLSARRRDERLSTLRLLGVTPVGVGMLAVVESTLIAAAGVLAGVILALATAPLVGLIPFRGAPLGAAALLPPVGVLAIAAGTVLLAVVSAVIGLRRVVISPLGVRTRAAARSVHGVRAVVALLAVAGAFALGKLVPQLGSGVALVAGIVAVFAVGLTVLNLVGPWAMAVGGRARLRRAKDAGRLLAARIVLDDPRAAWRPLNGVAMSSFMAVFAGTGVALMNAIGSDATGSREDALLVEDMRTGLVITLIASFLMVACSVAVTQGSEILDQRPLHQSLHALGVPADTVDAARRRAVMSPLLLTVLGSAACAGLLILPLLGIALIATPESVVTIALVLAAGVGLVWAATRITRPLLLRAFTDEARPGLP
ncbi:FtsX-like permease family protein [uncultured Microbacterium sp.]|uniref:FtsX-like permease family protein n=1 Tax=uncultured Microbacterium sp. TaxID=191216 RepID=UPI0025D42C49|nr:FtsX-like permease family protein [uncultured Microbacterium sp.]